MQRIGRQKALTSGLVAEKSLDKRIFSVFFTFNRWPIAFSVQALNGKG